MQPRWKNRSIHYYKSPRWKIGALAISGKLIIERLTGAALDESAKTPVCAPTDTPTPASAPE